MHSSTIILGVASLAQTVFGHGLLVSPPIRVPGPAMDAVCGKTVTDQIRADNTSHVEGLPEALAINIQSNVAGINASACNLFLCKGLQFADNPPANIQKFKAGQVVNLRASLPIPHKGPANVSIIDTKTNTAIGEPLITFDSYADESLATLPANNTNFNVTMPTNLGKSCSVAGNCVLQWFWFGTAADQTYESCVDFTA